MIYCLIQVFFGVFVVFTIHYIFEINIFQISSNIRGEIPLLVSEVIATLGLILTILFLRKNDESSVAIGVALFITAGYWFTSSTPFANPAVTIARMYTDTFTGISPVSALILFQVNLSDRFLHFCCLNILINNKLFNINF